MYFTARSYDLRYADNREFLRSYAGFLAASKVTQGMIKNDMKLNSPKASGERETIIIKYPNEKGRQVSNLYCSFT